MKKIIFTLAMLAVVTVSASATGAGTPRKEKVIVKECGYVSDSESTEMNTVLDRIQKESENTVIYPLLRMTQMVREKVQALKFEAKHRKKIKVGSINYRII